MSRHAAVAARVLTGVWVATVMGGLYLVLTEPDAAAYILTPWAVPVLVFAMTGSLITLTRPRHRVGWCFLWIGTSSFVSIVLAGVAVGPLAGADAAPWLSVIGEAVNTATIIFLVPVGMLIFPDGHLPSPRWRWLVWAAALVAVAGAFSAFVLGGWGGDPEQALLPSPLRPQLGDVGQLLSDTAVFPLLSVLFVSGGVSLVMRFRRSAGLERQQLLWVALGGGLTLVTFLLLLFLGEGNPGTGGFGTWAVALSFGTLPAAAAVAILRYRLYDIDLVISKALVVAGLGAFIAAVYIGIVVGVGQLFGAGEGPNLGLSIAATALVAVAFQPARRRLSRWANRLVYGDRATPYDVLTRFSRSAAVGDQEALDELAHVLAEATGSDVRFEVTAAEQLTTVAAATRTPDPGPGPAAIEARDGTAGYVEAIEHDGERLGSIVLTPRVGEILTDQDQQLVRHLGSALAVLLRNQQLTAQLRATIDEREASRGRLLAATDEARLLIERSLRDGPEQALTGIKLGIQRAVAGEIAQAPRTTQVLSQLIEDADHAIGTIRALASGAYPPLLAAEGLPAAIAAQSTRAPFHVTVQAPGVGRFERGLEAAIYFCVLEALQNAAKYAGARSVHVAIHEHDDDIDFEVRDDGVGFHPTTVTRGAGLTNMQDRLDTVGGSLDIGSAPGAGTTVRGRIPKQPVATAAPSHAREAGS